MQMILISITKARSTRLSHLQVGVGAFVMNEKREVLLVQENSGVQSGEVN